MNKKEFCLAIFFCLALMLVSCGPSPEAVATMTASAWTPTPLPTATPTPVPYDLTLNVKDESGNPIATAIVSLAELGGNAVQVDAQGSAAFPNLPGETITVSVVAQGYFQFDTQETVQRGENVIDVMLQTDPFGLMPEKACAPGETPLSVEDFQDQLIQGWGDLEGKLESGAPGLEIVEDIDQGGDWILKVSNTTDPGHVQIGRNDEALDGEVVRFWTRNNGGQHLHVGTRDTDTSRYIAFIYADQKGGRVDKFEEPSNFTVFSFSKSNIGDGAWHLIEISIFNDVYEIWIDGVQLGSWQDQKPLGPGNFFLDADFWQPDRIVEFDDISICAPAAQFTSLFNQ